MAFAIILLIFFEFRDDGFCRVNRGMSIDDFKFIYWMEYAHCMWGRALGIMFALPFSYFLRKGYITVRLGLKLYSFCPWCWAGSDWMVDG